MYNKYVDGWAKKMDAHLEPLSMNTPHDIELRLIDPSKNRRRIYGLTECVTLFGELCLRIVWGRIGTKHLRERSEIFESRAALESRRNELLARRRQHGYAEARVPSPADHAAAREIVEAHGLRLGDLTARTLVEAWRTAAGALRAYVARRGGGALDLEDVSSLASMYAVAAGVA